MSQLDCEFGCNGTEELDCQFCDGDGNASSQIDVDSFFKFKCTCNEGKWDCPCVGGVHPYEPTEPEAATRARRKVFAGPWA